MTYQEFLNSKIEIAPDTGFTVRPEDVNPALKPHQRDAVCWAIKGGRRGLFEAFGLGKTVQQLEFCRLTVKYGKEHKVKRRPKALIVLPLGVKQEFQRDAVQLLGWEKAPPYVKTMAEVKSCPDDIMLTNYERVRDGDIDPGYFLTTSLDEASCLRDFGSDTYQTFLVKFRTVQFRLVSTATPAPNRYKELINYAGYLSVMDTGQALTRFFQRDSTKANNLTLYPHREREFWAWVNSWALFLQRPSDLGYSDAGYDLPPLDIRWHKLKSDMIAVEDRDGQMGLFRRSAQGLKAAAAEKKETIEQRVSCAKEIVESAPGEHFVIWHDREAEREEIKKQIPETSEVYGSLDLETREQRIIDFSEGKTRILATKKSISGSGCNFQKFCHRAIFVGIDYEFNDFIQAIHRVYRFLQSKPVIIDIIYTENESEIQKALVEKWQQYDELCRKMAGIVREYGLHAQRMAAELKRKMGVERVVVKGELYTAINNDCVDELERMKKNSVDLIHTSIPFGNHYEYSPNYADFGHNPDDDQFFDQMQYLTPNLLKVLKPGRVMAVHVKDRVLFGNVTGTGFPTMEPFHAMCIRHYMEHGFLYFGMITVVTDVVRENNQTYRLGWSEMCKDGTKMGVGCPEYILLFRKQQTDHGKGYADCPVRHSKKEYTRAKWQIDASGMWRSSGNRLIKSRELETVPAEKMGKIYREFSRENIYDYQAHVKLAEKLEEEGHLPSGFGVMQPGSWTPDVWDDVNRMITLNSNQKRKNLQMHVCPLQLDIVERIIERYSNPGEVVLDPFAGLFTVPYMAVKMGRRGIGIELSAEYFADGLQYMDAAEQEKMMPTLFDII